MSIRAALGVLALVLAGGCGDSARPDSAPDARPDATEEPGSATSAETAARDATADAATPDSASRASPSGGDEPVLTLEAVLGAPVRGRLRYYDLWTNAEACVREVVAATPDRAAQVRYTLRLCAEDGRTEAVAKRWSKEAGPKTLFTDSIYETPEGETSHMFFECPYGTAWDVDVTAESVEGDRVRLAIRGTFLACTK